MSSASRLFHYTLCRMASNHRGVIKCATKCVAAASSSSRSSIRHFSSTPNHPPNSTQFHGVYNEPEYGVTDSEGFDPTGVKVPYLPDHIRVEMYNLHKADPTQNSDEALSQRFGTSLTRTRAVLVLMQKREALQRKLLGTEDGSVPPDWAVVYARHCEDREKYTAEVLFNELCSSSSNTATATKEAKDGEGGEMTTTDGAVSTTIAESTPTPASTTNGPSRLTSIPSVAALADILKRMDEHTTRLADQEHASHLMEESLQQLADIGVDTRFRELRQGRDLASITGYSPRLIGDTLDEYKTEMSRLRAKILSQTSAIPTKRSVDVEKELLTYTDRLANAPVDMSNKANVAWNKFNRWKFAYKDTADVKDARSVKPTMIRTRTGHFRPATPLEELGRSWYGKKPSHMDRVLLYDGQYKRYADPDGDDAAAKEWRVQRKVRREAMKAAAAGQGK